MAIHDVKTPSGEIVQVEAPEGASEESIIAYAAQHYKPSTEKPDTGFTGAFKSSLEQMKGQAALTAGKIGLMDEDAAEEYHKQQEEIAKRKFKPTEEGWLEAPVTKFKELLGGSLPYMAAPVVAGAATLALPEAIAAAPFLGGAAGIGGALGIGTAGAAAATGAATLASAAQFTGSNLARQMEEGKTLKDTSLANAALSSVPQALLDTASFKMTPGIRKLFGSVGKEISEETAEKIAKQGLLATTGRIALAGGKTAAIEGTTEAAQQVFERLQAGLNLTDEKARQEYFDNFLGGAVLGTVLGGFGHAFDKAKPKNPGQETEDTGETPPPPPGQIAPPAPPAPLLLAPPDEHYVTPPSNDPLLNPLGNFTKQEAPEIHDYINQYRASVGKPKLPNAFSIEDIADAGAPQQALDSLVANKVGYNGEKVTTQDVLNRAQQKNVDSTTVGFRDFLRRATGSEDINTLSPPQLFAAAKALDALKPGEEQRILASGTNALHYTPDQYNKAINGVKFTFGEFDNKPLGRQAVLSEIKEFTGLTQDKDAQRILDKAVEDGHLERKIEVRSVGGKKQNVESFTPGTNAAPLPAGMDIREEAFKRGEVPEAYDVKTGDTTLSTHEDQESAAKVKEQHEADRLSELKSRQKEVDKLTKEIENRNRELVKLQSTGKGDTFEFFTKSAEADAKNKDAQNNIDRLKDEQAGFAQPIDIVPRGTKPKEIKTQHVLYENDQPVAKFGDQYQAERHGISRLDDKTLEQIVASAPHQKGTLAKRYAKLAENELASRKNPELNKGVSTRKGLEGMEGRLAALGQKVSPRLEESLEKLRQQLLPILKKFGLEKVGLRIVESIREGNADGVYTKNLITLAMSGDNPLGVLRHEVIHALKAMGAFTDAEWKTLQRMAKNEWIKKFIGTDQRKAYAQEYIDSYHNMNGFEEYLQEEAIAEAFKHFAGAAKPPAGMIANLMHRLNNMFRAIANAFRSVKLTTPEQIFSDIERGAITPGRAEVQSTAQPAYSMRFSLSGDPTPLSVQGIRIYNKEIENLTKMIGGRIAGMTSEQTVEDVRKAIKKLQSFTAKGLKGREWYEQSAQAILSAFNGDKVLAEKLFQIIAITSAATEVSANFTKTVNAWNQFANGRPIKVGTGDTNKKIEALLYFGVDWEGRKTNTFYTNLLEAMEGKDTGRSTIDLHMTRMIFGKDQPTDAQYELAENMVRLLASKMNVPPRQVQAASWVTQKAKGMFEDYRKRGLKKNLNDKELREYAFERAVTDYSHLMKAKVTSLPITPELSEPSPSIRSRTQVITGEVIPSVKTEMSQMEEMSFPQKDKFTKDVMRSRTINKIADLLGIKSRIRVTVGSGGYEGKVNPNLKVQVINSNPAESESDAHKLAFAMSYVFKQDATPFFRADPNLLNVSNFGLQFKFNKDLTPAAQKKILDVMNKYLGADAGFTKVASNEIVMINYRGEDGTPFLMSDTDFVQAMGKVQEDVNKFVPIEASSAFGAKSEYPYHDWEQDAAGTTIVEWFQNSGAGRPNLQKSLDNLRESFIVTARDAVTKSGATPRFSLRGARPDQSALRPSDSGGRGISFNDRKEGSVSYSGSHYGKVKTDTLTAISYGSGLRGAEARRLSESDDPRIKRRVYFYIPKPNGTMPNIESGLGSHVYTQKLDNILGPGPAMSALFKQAGGNSNAFESLVVDNGYDGYSNPDYGMMVVLNHDVPVNYEGTVNDVHGGAKFSLRQQGTAKFKQWFGNSKITNPDGTPKVMYHGSANDIAEFIGVKAGAVFVTANPSIAEGYTELSEEYKIEQMLNEIQNRYESMSRVERQQTIKTALKKGVKHGSISQKGAKEMLQNIADAGFDEQSLSQVQEFILSDLKDKLETRANIMPLYVRAENTFDFDNKNHIKQVSDEVNRLTSESGEKASAQLMRSLETGHWEAVESDIVQQAVRNLGFDSFFIKELGQKNLAVYNPNQVKSAIGNNGEFSRDNNDVRFSFPNAPKNRYTKTSEVKTAGKAIRDTVDSINANIQDDNYWTSLRNAWVDSTSGLAQSLKSLPLFDSKGTLRADMLIHAKNQMINLIKNGLQSGHIVVNDDGSLIVRPSENNLARSLILADKLDNNDMVKQSGLSGRDYIAEVARALRGKDIMAEDTGLRQHGVQQLAQSKALRQQAKGETGRARKKTIKHAYRLHKLGKKNAKMNREVQIKPEDIAWAEKQYKQNPAVKEILDIWKDVNDSLITLWEKTGLLNAADAAKYRNKDHYVPLFASREDLEEDAFFKAGTGAKTTRKLKQLEGSKYIRNIWENLDKHYAAMTASAYENQTRRVAVSQLVDLGLATESHENDKRVNLRFKQNGKVVNAILENPNDLAAFQMMNQPLNPIMKAFGFSTKVLRAGALLNPMYWIKQLVRDPLHASLVANSGIVTPFHSARAFLEILANNSEEAKILAQRGVIGSVDSTVSIHEFLNEVGKEKTSPSRLNGMLHRVMQIHEASDAATRVEIYKKAYAEGISKGMNKNQATDFAVHKARESINFSTRGNSPILHQLRQMIPFLSASITSLDTVYRAATGYGLNPAEKAEAQRIFRSRAMMMVAMATAYAMMYQDDEEYKKLPDYVKDNNWLIPAPGGKGFIKVPTPFEVGFLFKSIPEMGIRYMAGNSTGKEVLMAFKAGLIQNLPSGGIPIPQAGKPILESMANYSFFTGRPIEGMSDQGLPVANRGARASEFAKTMSAYGLDKISMSPAKIDNLIQGYAAELGVFTTSMVDQVIYAVEGKTPPSKNLENMPFMKSFMTDPNVSKAVSDFYDIESKAKQTSQAFTDLKNKGLGKDAKEYIADEEHKKLIQASPTLRKIGQQMTEIRKQMNIITENQDIPAEVRRERLNNLNQQFNKVAAQSYKITESLGLR